MHSLEKELASFARHHGGALDSNDPYAVLEAEANLATVVNADWVERLKVDVGLRSNTNRSDGDHPGRLVWPDPTLLSEPWADEVPTILHRLKAVGLEVRDSDLTWSNEKLHAPRLDARNEVAAGLALPPLKSISLIEGAMPQDSRIDWGQVGMGLGPYLEDVLRSCLFDVGRRAWEQGARLENRFYSPILESTFERGGTPTLVCFEAIAYLLRQPVARLASLPELGPLGTRLVLNSQFVAALAAFRAERNRLHHAGRAPWPRDTYARYCDSLVGSPSASEWLTGSFAVDGSGMLDESGRNLLSSLLVNRYLFDCVEGRPDVGLTLLLTGFLQRSDLPSGWASRLLTSARSNELLSKSGTVLALVKHAHGVGVLSPLEFSSADMEGLFESVGIDEALELVGRNALTPSDFPSAWKRHAAEQSSWWQYQKLLACGLLCPDESDAGLRRRKLSQLRLREARGAVESGAHPSEFDDAWREKMAGLIESVNLGDLDWLLENGLLAGAKLSKPPLASWKSKGALHKAALLVRAGLADPGDFRPSWGPLLSAAAAPTKSE